jgi:DNA polymerase
MGHDQRPVVKKDTDMPKKEEIIEIGPYVTAEAQNRNMTPVDLAGSILCNLHQITVEDKHGNPERVMFIPGHTVSGPYGPPEKHGPKPEVIVIGKMPWKEEVRAERLFAGVSGEIMAGALNALDLNYDNWYFTNVVRFMPPQESKNLPTNWIRECRWFLEQEIQSIRPKCLVLLGSVATKAILGRTATLKKYRGVEDAQYDGIPVVVTYHPAAIAKEPSLKEAFKRDLAQIKAIVGDTEVEKLSTTYEVITTEKRLAEVVDALIAKDHKRFTLDCEWGGTTGSTHLTGKLRTIQFAVAPGVGYCVELRREELVDVFDPTPAAAYPHLQRLLCRPEVEIGGHSLRADLKWFVSECGFDLSQYFYNGADTMLMYNLLYSFEDGFGLENVTMRYTDLGRYDLQVSKWLDENTKKKDRTVYLMKRGYACIPREILNPYGIMDVDAPFRAWPRLVQELQARSITQPYMLSHGPFQGCWVRTFYDLYRYIVHPANFPLNEIESVGILADKDRLTGLTELFDRKCVEIAATLGQLVNWDGFNPRSNDQLKDLIFGTQPVKGQLRPEGAVCLSLTPIKTTDKPSKDWSKVGVEAYRKGKVAPSTDGETVKILLDAETDPQKLGVLKEVQKFKFVDQIRKNILCSPKLNPLTGESEFLTGLVSEIDPDGRIRTTLLQLTETGRYSSSHPNLQSGGCKTLRIAGTSEGTSATTWSVTTSVMASKSLVLNIPIWYIGRV